MSKTVNQEWAAFIATLPEDQRRKLVEAGFDLTNIHVTNLAKPHRYFYDERMRASKASTSNVQPFSDSDCEVEGILASIVAKIIDAYGCINDPKVLLHNDCFRIALGYTNYASMADVANQYKVTRATVSWRVKQIQEKLGLPQSIYMRSDEICEKSVVGQLYRKGGKGGTAGKLYRKGVKR